MTKEKYSDTYDEKYQSVLGYLRTGLLPIKQDSIEKLNLNTEMESLQALVKKWSIEDFITLFNIAKDEKDLNKECKAIVFEFALKLLSSLKSFYIHRKVLCDFLNTLSDKHFKRALNIIIDKIFLVRAEPSDIQDMFKSAVASFDVPRIRYLITRLNEKGIDIFYGLKKDVTTEFSAIDEDDKKDLLLKTEFDSKNEHGLLYEASHSPESRLFSAHTELDVFEGYPEPLPLTRQAVESFISSLQLEMNHVHEQKNPEKKLDLVYALLAKSITDPHFGFKKGQDYRDLFKDILGFGLSHEDMFLKRIFPAYLKQDNTLKEIYKFVKDTSYYVTDNQHKDLGVKKSIDSSAEKPYKFQKKETNMGWILGQLPFYSSELGEILLLKDAYNKAKAAYKINTCLRNTTPRLAKEMNSFFMNSFFKACEDTNLNKENNMSAQNKIVNPNEPFSKEGTDKPQVDEMNKVLESKVTPEWYGISPSPKPLSLISILANYLGRKNDKNVDKPNSDNNQNTPNKP